MHYEGRKILDSESHIQKKRRQLCAVRKDAVPTLKLKSLEEVASNCREMIHRYLRRWLKKNQRPCPFNCQSAIVVGKNRVIGCEGCGSKNPDQCLEAKKFVPLFTKEELHAQFRERLRNQEILLRDYRDIATLLWVMGGFDENVDESVLAGVEKREKPVAPNNPVKPGPSTGDGGNGAVPKQDDPKPARNAPIFTRGQLRPKQVQPPK